MINRDEMDMDVDGLCDMFSAQGLWCAEENYQVLCHGIRETRRLLQTHANADASGHIAKTKERYCNYMAVIEDWGTYNYLVDNIKMFCGGEMSGRNQELLFITYFIDSEILQFLET